MQLDKAGWLSQGRCSTCGGSFSTFSSHTNCAHNSWRLRVPPVDPIFHLSTVALLYSGGREQSLRNMGTSLVTLDNRSFEYLSLETIIDHSILQIGHQNDNNRIALFRLMENVEIAHVTSIIQTKLRPFFRWRATRNDDILSIE